MLDAQYQPRALSNSRSLTGQNFNAVPRVRSSKPRYRGDQYGQPRIASAKLSGAHLVPQNIMFDRRVYRGSTNAAMVIPAGSYPNQLFQRPPRRVQTTRGGQRQRSRRAKAAEDFFTRDIKTPEAQPGTCNIDVQCDQFVEAITDKAPTYEIATMTEFVFEQPSRYWPEARKKGVDKKTLIEDNELFLFNDEAEPILSVLCGKTLELARMEVMQEEELRVMRQQQDELRKYLEEENDNIKGQETLEQRKLQQFQEKKQRMTAQKEQLINGHQKFSSRRIAKMYCRNLKQDTYKTLRDLSFFADKEQLDLIDNQIKPWLHKNAAQVAKQNSERKELTDIFVFNYVDETREQHNQVIKAEIERREQELLLNEKLELQRQEEKERRREARIAKRRAAEREALRNRIKNELIRERGNCMESILLTDTNEIDGNDTDAPITGMIGGVLGQLIICFNTVFKHFSKDEVDSDDEEENKDNKDNPDKESTHNKETDEDVKSKQQQSSDTAKDPEQESLKKAEEIKSEKSKHQQKEDEKSAVNQSDDENMHIYPLPIYKNDILNPIAVQNFLFKFFQEIIKQEFVTMKIAKEYEEFLGSLEKPMQINEMRVMKEKNYQKLRAILRDVDLIGDPILKVIRQNLSALGIDRMVYDLVYEGFWDLYCKKPLTPELSVKKMEGFITRFRLMTDITGLEVNNEEEQEKAQNKQSQQKNNATEVVSEEEDEANSEEVPESKLQAIVRLRIPLRRQKKSILENDDGQDSQANSPKDSVDEEAVLEDDSEVIVLGEEDIEDSILQIPAKIDDLKVYVIHQAAQRQFRNDVAIEMIKNINELNQVSQDEFLHKLENEAVTFEDTFLQLYRSEEYDDDVPIFDFENNGSQL